MDEYTVEIVGDFDAATPREAASQFRDWVMDLASGGSTFSVRVTNSRTLQVQEVEL